MRKVDRFLRRLAAELRGDEMPGEIRGLSEMVRSAKASMKRAHDSTAQLANVAKDLNATLDQVEGTTQELAAANRELQSELATMSNGGPPLEDHGAGVPPSVHNIRGISG